MGIRIDEINIKNLGPITELNSKVATINLIYGMNESGKTYLVDFLIQSLFRNINYPGARKLSAGGQIKVTGLGNSNVLFSPTTKKKLEDFLSGDNKTIPTNISRLLVVRAGELSLVDKYNVGIDRSILEEYLSNTGLINSIRARIPATIQNSIFKDQVIQGNRQGLVKDHFLRKSELEACDKLMAAVNADYSSGYRASIQMELKELLDQLNSEKEAKCYLAYNIYQENQLLEQHLNQIPFEELSQIERNLDKYWTKSESLKTLEEMCQVKVKECSEYPWLKAALEEYQNLTTQGSQLTKSWLLILAGLFLIGAVVLILVQQIYLAVGGTLIGTTLGYLYIHNLKQVSLKAVQNAEISRIATEFMRKFNRQLTDLATLRLFYDEQKEAEIAAGTITSQIKNLQIELTQLEQDISDNIFRLTGTRLPKESWIEKVQEIRRRVNEMKERSGLLKIKFAELQIEEKDFNREPSNIVYDDVKYKKLESQVNDLKEQLQSEDERLNSLRQRLAQETRQDISTPWENLIEKLQELRINSKREYQAVTAKILAGIVVNNILDDLYKEEEKSICEGLRSYSVTSQLRQMTTHYNRIEFENGIIRLADPYSEFNFNELSTATQDQVLLALRLGFSSRCFFGQSMFLVLDDAFQHSDWNRRKNLIDGVLEIAQQGWQIIYLTMDDHIRDLFREKAESSFPGDFNLVEL